MTVPPPAGDRPCHVAVSDCERIRSGLIAQPVNSLSSLAYCGAGMWILRRSPRDVRRRSLAAAAVAAGFGSAAYHGPGGRSGKALHDLTATWLAAQIALSVMTQRSLVSRVRVATLLTIAGTVHATSRTGRVFCRPGSLLQGHAVWHVLGAVAAAVAARD